MKRLQFRHHDNIFESRELALSFFENITNPSHTASTIFGKSLYAEPMVVKYKDNEGNVQIIFALGVDSPNTPYHLIDSKDILEKIKINSDNISIEKTRAEAAEASLDKKIDNEQKRAEEAESALNTKIENTESALNTKIDENLTEIISVTPSSTNVLEEYALKNAKDEILGEHIKIYKDSSLVSAKIAYKGANGVRQLEDGSFEFSYGEDIDKNQEYFYLIYRNENGELNIVGIDFENFLMEAEFGDGMKVVDHVASIKIKEGEKYLETSKDGIYTINIDESIAKTVEEERVRAEGSEAKLRDNIIIEQERATAKEAELQKSIDDEVVRATTKENELQEVLNKEVDRAEKAESDISKEVKANKIFSKDVALTTTESGTNLTIQTDEITITKLASASTIYDTNVAVLGSLLHVKKVEPTNSTIKSRYELQGADGKMIGDPIELMVESSLIDVRRGKKGASVNPETGEYIEGTGSEDTIDFIYRLVGGEYKLIQITVSEYFTDSHFGKGLNNQDGVISIVEGDGNEFLVIGEDTIAVVGVNAAINRAKQEAINEATSRSNNYTDGKISDLTDHVNTSVDSIVAALNQSIESNIDTINGTINDEKNRAMSVEEHLAERIDLEISYRFNEISRLEGVLTQEITDRKAEDNVLRGNINDAKNEAIKSAKEEAKNVAVEEVAKIVDGADSKFDTLKEIAEWIATDETGTANIVADVESLKNNINILNGDKNVNGSVISTVVKGVDDAMIINGPTITVVTPEDAANVGSLLRKVIISNNNDTQYYVSNRATEMLYVPATGMPINLNEYIVSLETKVAELEARINNIEENGTGTSVSPEEVKNIIKEYLSGIDNEIKVTEKDDKLTIGFADDAIFG